MSLSFVLIAAWTLCPSPQDIDGWIRQLASDDVRVRNQAGDALVWLWESDAARKRVEEVEKSATETDLRASARSILGRIELRRALGKPFVEAIADVDGLFATGQHQLPVSFPKWLDDPASAGLENPEHRRTAFSAAVARLTTEQNKCVALQMMGRRLFKGKEARRWAASVAPLLQDPSPQVRAGALRVLGDAKLQEFEERIAELLSDSAECRMPLFIDPDPLCSHSPKGVVCAAASDALSALGAKGAAGKIAALLTHPHPVARCRAVSALGLLRATAFADKIADLLEDPDRDTRAYAVDAMAQLGARGYAKKVAALLATDEWLVKYSALWTLVEFDAQDQAAAIRARLKDEDGGLDGDAARALAKLGRKECAEEIAALLDSKNPHTVGCAVQALRVLGAKDQARALKQAAVRNSARLGRFLPAAAMPFEESGPETTLADWVDEVLRGWGLDPEALK